MNNNFWIHLSFFLMILITFKVIMLTYISKLDVDKDIVMAIVFTLVGLLGLLYLIIHKYDTLKFIKKCNFSLVTIIVIVALIMGIQYKLLPRVYEISPNPGLCGSILNLNVVFVFILSYYLFRSSVNLKTIMGVLISIYGLYLVLNN